MTTCIKTKRNTLNDRAIKFIKFIKFVNERATGTPLKEETLSRIMLKLTSITRNLSWMSSKFLIQLLLHFVP